MSRDRLRISRRLVKIRAIEERQQLVRVRDVRDQLADAEAALEARREATDSLVADMGQRASVGLPGEALQGYSLLLDAARLSEKQAAAAVDQVRVRERAETAKLLTTIKARQAADKLAERTKEAIEREERRAEDRMLDELGQRSFKPL